MFVADRERKREADLELVVFTNDLLCQLKKSWQQQCDQIGRFLKVLCNMVSDKISPNSWRSFGLK